MALLQKVFNSKNIQVVSAPTIDKIDPRVKVKRIMSAEKFTTVKISLDTLPDSLVTYIGDFCNLSSLATLSISCRKMSQLIRVRPLEPPQGGFSVLKKEADAIIHRMEKIQHTSPFMVGHDTVHPHLEWGIKISDALVARYGKDTRILSIEENLRRAMSNSTGNESSYWGRGSKYWQLRIVDNIASDMYWPFDAKSRSHYLYYWDDRDGPDWEGWWITPSYIGYTGIVCAHSRDRAARNPNECIHWQQSTIRVIKNVHGPGVFVRDLQTNHPSVPYEGLYLPIVSTHSIGNRLVYRLARRLADNDKWFIDSHLAIEASFGMSSRD